MERHTIQVGAYEVNCTLLAEGHETIIVDPGQEGERILKFIRKKGWTPKAILLTHAHFDHIGGIPALQAAFPALPVHVGAADVVMVNDPRNQLPGEYPPIAAKNLLSDFSVLAPWGIRAIMTPGHSPGGVSYYLESERLLLSGDTLFAGSVGRTDFPGGDLSKMITSLRTLAELPDETEVIPGHGPFTTIGEEKSHNRFLKSAGVS